LKFFDFQDIFREFTIFKSEFPGYSWKKEISAYISDGQSKFFFQVWTWKENVTDLFPDLEDSRMVFFAVLLMY
jgi:hypothetical protein